MRRCALAAIAAALILPAAPAEARPCAHADADPARMSVAQARTATVCLLNVERRRFGLPPLRANGGLALAGQRHAADMIRAGYFSHDSRSGPDFRGRIVRTGYLGGGSRAIVGENLAWGSGRRATPRGIVAAWMASPGHRANVLRRSFREVGIGVVRRVPRRSLAGATYAAEFGRRF